MKEDVLKVLLLYRMGIEYLGLLILENPISMFGEVKNANTKLFLFVLFGIYWNRYSNLVKLSIFSFIKD